MSGYQPPVYMPFAPDVPRRVDLMQDAARIECKVPPYGFVALIDMLPRLVPEGQTADSAVVQAARVSYGAGTKQVTEDTGLIRYLRRHRHTTPFEMVEFKFHCAMPIFVARQWIRHRTASVNEYSGRYSVMPDKFFRPDMEDIRQQSRTNKQGRDEELDVGTAQEFLDFLKRGEERYGEYTDLLGKGVSRELARIALPQSLYTEWYWKIDLHNLMHFLGLRMDGHAQKEIRDSANAMCALVEPMAPESMRAFKDYMLEATTLTGPGRRVLKRVKSGENADVVMTEEFGGNKRERAEFVDGFGWMLPSLESQVSSDGLPSAI